MTENVMAPQSGTQINPKPTVGRIVHYRLKEGKSKGEIRPAIITRLWTDDCVQLTVFVDGSNDGYDSLTIWETSVNRGDEVGYWNWPARA